MSFFYKDSVAYINLVDFDYRRQSLKKHKNLKIRLNLTNLREAAKASYHGNVKTKLSQKGYLKTNHLWL